MKKSIKSQKKRVVAGSKPTKSQGKEGFSKKNTAFSGKETRAPKKAKNEQKSASGNLLWGLHAVREAWLNPNRTCHHLYLTRAGEKLMTLALQDSARAKLGRPEPQIIERDYIEGRISEGSVHQGILLSAAPLPEQDLDVFLNKEDLPDLLLVLDQVTDPHNVGAILRSAAAFGAGGVVVTERNAPNTTGVMAKTACGALEYVPFFPVVNLSRALVSLQKAGYWCVGLAEEGERALGDIDISGRTAIVLGAEGDGLRRLTREHCDELAHLPTQPPIGSLNVSNAAAVALYEARKQKT